MIILYCLAGFIIYTLLGYFLMRFYGKKSKEKAKGEEIFYLYFYPIAVPILIFLDCIDWIITGFCETVWFDFTQKDKNEDE